MSKLSSKDRAKLPAGIVLRIIDKWQDPDHIRLHAGEMTNQEMRSVLAVLRAVRADILLK